MKRDALEMILLLVQSINAARRMIDPSGADPVIAEIVAQAASGGISNKEARKQLMDHMRQENRAVMDDLREGLPDDAA